MPNLEFNPGRGDTGLGADADTYQCLSHPRRRLLTRMDRTIDDTGDADPLPRSGAWLSDRQERCGGALKTRGRIFLGGRNTFLGTGEHVGAQFVGVGFWERRWAKTRRG